MVDRARAIPSWLVLAGFFACVVAAGAALAPVLFAAGRAGADWAQAAGWDQVPGLGWLADQAERADFQRYFNRSVLLAALVLLWPAVRVLRLSRTDLPGLRPSGRDLRLVGIGLVLAALPLLAMGGLLLGLGAFRFRPPDSWASALGGALVAAAAVSLLEEWMFRGAFTGIVRRSLGPRATLWFIAVLFALLHFLEPPEGVRIPDAAVHAATGFHLAGVMLGRLLEPETFAGAFLTLLGVALILGWMRQRTGAIWFGVGLHAGWVLALKAFSAATRRVHPAKDGLPDLWIGDDLRTGLLPLVFLALTAVLAGRIARGSAPSA